MWACRSCYNITAAALLTLVFPPPPQNHNTSSTHTQSEKWRRFTVLKSSDFSMATCVKIENRLLLCWRVDTCVFVKGFARPAFMQGKTETQTRGFLSECSCCLLVYWVRIYYSAIFLCCPPEQGGRGREARETERGGLATAQECVPIG